MSANHVGRKGAALFMALALGVPVVIVTAVSLANAYTGAREMPLRYVLGDERFEELKQSDSGFPHYLGNRFRAPDFELPLKAGGTWALSQKRGKVVVLNFWTRTCQPCLEEMPSLQTFAEMVAGLDDVEVVAVSVDESWEEIQDLIAETPDLTHLLDSKRGVVSDRFGTRLFPETWIIDKKGMIRFRYDGALDWASPIVVDLVKSFR